MIETLNYQWYSKQSKENLDIMMFAKYKTFETLKMLRLSAFYVQVLKIVTHHPWELVWKNQIIDGLTSLDWRGTNNQQGI